MKIVYNMIIRYFNMKNYIFQTQELIMIQQIDIEAKQIKFMSKFIQFLVLLERKMKLG